MVAYHPRRYVSCWLIAKAMPPYETYAAPGGRRLSVWRAERRSSLAGPRLGRESPQRISSEHLLSRGDGRYRVHPGTQSLLAHGARGGDPVRVPPGLRRLFPEARRPCHPTQTPSPPGPAPRQRRRGAPPRGALGRVPIFRRRSGGPGQAWSGAGRGNVDLGPVVLGELGRARRRGRAIGRSSDRGCTSGAARAAPPGQRAGASLSSEGSHSTSINP